MNGVTSEKALRSIDLPTVPDDLRILPAYCLYYDVSNPLFSVIQVDTLFTKKRNREDNANVLDHHPYALTIQCHGKFQSVDILDQKMSSLEFKCLLQISLNKNQSSFNSS